MAKGQKHYLPNGKEYNGPTHKMKDGTLHTGAKHTASSKVLSHSPGGKKMSSKQMKIAGAAAPTDRITGADFAALRNSRSKKSRVAKSMGYA